VSGWSQKRKEGYRAREEKNSVVPRKLGRKKKTQVPMEWKTGNGEFSPDRI